MSVELAKIRMDGGTQSRAAINEDTVAEYAEAMEKPETVFPPCIVYHDGRDYWLADGFHRVAAWKRIGRLEVPAEVRQGDRRRAVLHSCGANAAHGLRRTNADKRRAVQTLLEDQEWSQWSDNQIARQCGVSQPFVSRLRGDVTSNVISEPRTYTTKHGTEAQMDTSRIGKPERQPDAHAARADLAKPQPETADRQPEPDRSQTGAEPEPAPDPYGYSRLTDEALLDTANGLRADLDEVKAKNTALRRENETLKSQVAELSNGDDSARKLAAKQRELDAAKYRRDEAMAEVKRMEFRMKKLADRVKQLEGEEFTL